MGYITVEEFKALNERQRRFLAAQYAIEFGKGGVKEVNRIYGISANTVLRGIREIQNGETADGDGRVRSKGAGKKNYKSSHPEMVEDILKLAALTCNEVDGIRYAGESIRSLTEKFNEAHDYTVNRSIIHHVLTENGYVCSRLKKNKVKE
jgi:hypothetical protein